MRRFVVMASILAVLVGVAVSTVFALSYEGEDFCQDSPAWPGGTYLGQMHPYHSDFYRGYAERRGWDPCETWATDQRNSAIRGLSELGFQIGSPDGVVQDPVRQYSGEGPGLSEQFDLEPAVYVVRTQFSDNVTIYTYLGRQPASIYIQAAVSSTGESESVGNAYSRESGVLYALLAIHEKSKVSISIDAADLAKWRVQVIRLQ